MIECSILNRLRGTGVIKHFGTLKVLNKVVEIKFVGNHLYGLWIALVLGLATMNAWLGLAVLVAYFLGESSGWGKWLGWLVTHKEHRTIELVNEHQKDDEGRGYPWIHYLTSFFIKEKATGSDKERISTQFWYCVLALSIRGFYWWLPVYLVLASFGVIGYIEALMIAVGLGIAFPIAAEIGRRIKFERIYDLKFIKLSFSPGWENQEIVYGLMQGMCLWYVILKVVYE